ncbi:hypothetical protein EGW08_021536 [Elysia chlorotica]|uniref:SMB domain-containing protein n=1 Tax=Elysia chlorotica TaxID=188477 RepID=A0A3S0Z6V5_ELYCH|nr:hypothetical protein EGW08_021536 [Elysia chlorotica]
MPCSCDSQCIVYGDCCYDFHDACPEFAKYHLSANRQASAVCVGTYTYLVYRNEDRSYGHRHERPVSMKDALDSLAANGPAVTDLSTGEQYWSLKDLEMLHPDRNFSKPEELELLAKWTPSLHPTGRYGLIDHLHLIVRAVQNPLESFDENLIFLFEPPESTQPRTCLPQTELACIDMDMLVALQFKIANLTVACDLMVNNMTLRNASASFEWRADRTMDNVQVQTMTGLPVTRTTRRRYNLASTTEYTTPMGLRGSMEKDPAQPCYVNFKIDSGKRPMGFSYLLNMEERGELSIMPTTDLKSWNSVTCSDASQPDSEDAGDSGDFGMTQGGSCHVEVDCIVGLIFANDVCSDPVVLMLELTAATGIAPEDFQLGVENLISSSGILTHPEVVLWQDPNTCIGQGRGGSSSQSTVYYGLYIVVHIDPNWSRVNNFPVKKSLQTALSGFSMKNLTVADVFQRAKLCILLQNDTRRSLGNELMRNEGIDPISMQDMYMENKFNRSSAADTGPCEGLPWAWSGDIFTDPFVSCEIVWPAEKSTRRVGIGITSEGCQNQGPCEKDDRSSGRVLGAHTWNLLCLLLAVALAASLLA